MAVFRNAGAVFALFLALICAACAGTRDSHDPATSRGSPEGDDAKAAKREAKKEKRQAARRREEPAEQGASPESGKAPAPGKESPWHARGVFDFVVKDQATHGRVARDDASDSTDGSPRSATFALDLDLLFDKWMVSEEASTTFLPASLDLGGGALLATTRTHYGNWDLVLGPKILEIPAEAGESPDPETGSPPRRSRKPFPVFRLDAFAGMRSHRFSEWENFLGILPSSHGSFGWRDPIAGLRAEWMPTDDMAVRFRGDTKFSGQGSDHAWRASAAVVFWASHRVSLAVGWEVNSIHFEKGRGRGLDRYDILLNGPFLALEIRF